MKKLNAIFRLTLLAAFLFTAACEQEPEPAPGPGTEKPDPDPDPDPVIYGKLTHDGETRDILRATFNYIEDENPRYRIVLSPVEVEEGKTMEIVEIEIYEVMFDKEWNLATDQLPAQLAIRYRKGFDYYQPYLAYLNDGNLDGYPDADMREGTIRASRGEGNNFEIEIKDMELQDGTTLSCSAKGVFQERFDPFMDGRIAGTADYSWVIAPGQYPKYDGGTIQFKKAQLYMNRAYNLTGAGNETLMEITGFSEDGDSNYKYSFIVRHQDPQLVSQKYEIVVSEFGYVDTENSTLMDVNFNLDMYYAPTDDNFWLFNDWAITQGSLTMEVQEQYLKITMPGDFDAQYGLQPAEFIFDLTNN